MLASALTGIALCWLVATGFALAWVDLRQHRLPDRMVAAAGAGGVVMLLAASFVSQSLWPIGRAVLAATAVFLGMFGMAVAAPGHLGYGDVKLAGVLGFYLGWFSWRHVVLGLAAGFVIGAVTALALMARHRTTARQQRLPFGPALLAGTIGTLLVAVSSCTTHQDTAGTSSSNPATTTTSSSPAVSTTSTTRPTAATDTERRVLAAYTGMWRATAAASHTSDWQSPEIARYAQDEALVKITQALYADHERGVTARGEPVLSPTVTDLVPADTPTQARVLDCGDSSSWLKYRDGELIDEPGGRRQITAIVQRDNDSWKVTDFAIKEVGSC